VLAEVKSQPLRTLVSQMLLSSDNTLADMLARATAKAQGMSGTFSSLQGAIEGPLTALGLTSASALVIKDGSGESAENSVPPLFVAQLLVKIRANEKGLGVVYDGMPVGGQTGDLEDRFTDANAAAAGHVVAKPGWIDNERSLAGIVTAADGTSLAFAFYGLGEAISFDTRLALDTLTTAVYTCGNNLSNN
jgi:D-alanyl-D-alanine carboxypeptidase/D-alanyl-D-alanine-endopeptidase (penicillin-binding protein 4)